MRVQNTNPARSSAGFTLVELMVTLVISMMVMATVYVAYRAQQRTYTAQEQVAEMQQNLRAAMMIIVRDLRMAGYDPTYQSGAGITVMQPGQISMTMDTSEDGDTLDAGEAIDFGFSVADDAARDGIPDADANGDGVPDAAPLRKQTWGPVGAGGYQEIAENIQAVEFLYLDALGAVTAVPADVRSVQISVLARAGQADPQFTDTLTYTPASGTVWDLNAGAGNAANDNFRRRLLITTVNCRNMGL